MMRLEGAGVALERGGRCVLHGLSFSLNEGEALAVTGPNGAGKSTLLRAVAGLAAVAAGTLTLAPWEGHRAGAMHLVGHQNAIKLGLSAEANVAFWMRTLGEGADGTVVEAALERVGLLSLAETPAQFLSQGQRRRLSLARLAAVQRPVWLLDEPTAGLDAASREAFAAMMAGHVAAGGLILAATHEPLGLAAATLDLRAAADEAARHAVREDMPA